MSPGSTTTRFLYEGVYSKWLPKATLFSRATGYFSLSALSAGAEAYSEFFSNGGMMRLLTGEVFSYGSSDTEPKNVDLTASNFQYRPVDCFLRLLDEGKLVVKLATPRDSYAPGIFHAKYGILDVPSRSSIGFTGSANETKPGITGENYEDTVVYDNDAGGKAQEYLAKFELLWSDNDPDWAVLPYQIQPAGDTEVLTRPLYEELCELEHWRLERRLTRLELRALRASN